MDYMGNTRSALVAAILFAVVLFAGQAIAQIKPDDVLRIDTTMVTVPIRVFDAQGRSLTGLNSSDFRIFEDKHQQDIAAFDNDNSPITVALMLDISDSAKFRLSDIQDATVAFLGKLRQQDKVMVFAFDKNLNRVYAGSTDNSAEISKRVHQIITGGGTSLYDAIESVANRELNKYQGKKAIVVLTDGVDTSSQQDWIDNLRVLHESDAPVYAIQYETASDLRGTVANMPDSASVSLVTSKGETLAVAYQRGTRI